MSYKKLDREKTQRYKRRCPYVCCASMLMEYMHMQSVFCVESHQYCMRFENVIFLRIRAHKMLRTADRRALNMIASAAERMIKLIFVVGIHTYFSSRRWRAPFGRCVAASVFALTRNVPTVCVCVYEHLTTYVSRVDVCITLQPSLHPQRHKPAQMPPPPTNTNNTMQPS